MLGFFRKRRAREKAARVGNCAERAGVLFDGGYNCAQAVLQATTGRSDPELLAMAEAFGSGIGESGCLCGAVTGGVMALALQGKGARNGDLVAAFRKEFRTTCCRGLSKDYHWLSREHLTNCRRLTVGAAAMVEKLLDQEPRRPLASARNTPKRPAQP
jgi:C_GCAxxG_C_C family probable redox protein